MENSALQSLQGNYTDSENEDNTNEVDYSDPEEKQIKAILAPTKKGKPKRLVSYNDPDHQDEISDEDDEPAEPEEVEENKDGEKQEPEDKFAKFAKKYGFSLPPEPKTKPDQKLQETISSIHQKMINNPNFNLNNYIQDEKKFRNPSIYDKLIQYLEINELGTNFPPEIYDVSIYGPESFYEELAKAQKLEMDKLEKQKKDNNVKTEVIIKESAAKRKSKWDQQAPSSATASVVTSSTSKTTVISAFGTLKKPKV